MIWKGITYFGIALLALSEARAPISKQSVKIEKYKKLSHVGSQEPEHHEVYAWAYPSYEFKYEVADPHTHDFKGQHEKRNGDEVKGEYWLIQPDGLKRTVKYYADKSSGFKANVDYIKLQHDSEENNEENEESASGEEENSNEESSSIGNENSNNEEGDENESQNNNNESDNDNEGETASVGEQRENKYQWRQNGVNFWGKKRGREESNDEQNYEVEETEQEAGASKHNENQESENVEESENNEESENVTESENDGNNGGNEESSAVENKNEKKVITHEYHFIIHHPKYIKKLMN